MMNTLTNKLPDHLPTRTLGWLGVLALTCSFSVFAASNTDTNDIDWFVGATSADLTDTGVNEELSTTAVSVTNVAVDESRLGWKLNVGYDITTNVAIEASYMDLNETNIELNSVVSDPNLFSSTAKKIHPNSTDGFSLGSIYRYNITDNIGLTGSIGLFNWEGDFTTNSLVSDQNLNNDGLSGTDVYFGLGGGYQLTEDMTLSIEWERYQLDDDDTQMWSIGVNYHFK